jgi:hypothetical protein
MRQHIISIESPRQYVLNRRSGRLRERTVSEYGPALQLGINAVLDNEFKVDVLIGGTVVAAYGYRAHTEAAFITADPSGNVLVWVTQTGANYCSKSKVVRETIGVGSGLFDDRYGELRKQQELQSIQKLHYRIVGACCDDECRYLKVEITANPTARLFLKSIISSGDSWGPFFDWLEENDAEIPAPKGIGFNLWEHLSWMSDNKISIEA